MDPIHISLVTGPRDWWHHFTFESVKSALGRFVGINVVVVEYADFRDLNSEYMKTVLETYLRRKTVELMRASMDPTFNLEEIANTIDTASEFLLRISSGVPLTFEYQPDSMFRTSPGSLLLASKERRRVYKMAGCP